MVGRPRVQFSLRFLLLVFTLAALIGGLVDRRRFTPVLSINYLNGSNIMCCQLQYSERHWEKYCIMPPYTAADLIEINTFKDGKWGMYMLNEPWSTPAQIVREKVDKLRSVAGIVGEVKRPGVYNNVPPPLADGDVYDSASAIAIRRVPGRMDRHYITVRLRRNYTRTFRVKTADHLELEFVFDYRNGRRWEFMYDKGGEYTGRHYQITPQMEQRLEGTLAYLRTKNVSNVGGVKDILVVPVQASIASSLIATEDQY